MVFLTVFIVALLVFALTPTPAFAPNKLKKNASALPPIDSALCIDLVRAVIEAGASVPSALIATDKALGEEEGESGLGRVAHLLLMGASWDEAWQSVDTRFEPLRDSLAPAWVAGAAPVPLLERSASSIRQARARTAREAASELGAKLVAPLGLCFLPAFVLFGVVPVVVSTGISLFTP